MKHLLCAFTFLVLLSACGSKYDEDDRPLDQRRERRETRGTLTGEGGLFSLGGSDQDEGKGGGALGVNAYLWRATLDTLSFMPLVSADPFGGTIITDWYEDPKAPAERYKATAIILDKTLRADGVRVTVFKQKLEKGAWRDQKVDDRLSRQLEDTVLTRARELKIAQVKK